MLSKYALGAVTKDTNYQLLTDRKEEFQKDSSNLPTESLMPPKWALAEASWSRRQHRAHYTQWHILSRFQLFRKKIWMSLQMVHLYSVGGDWAERQRSTLEIRHSSRLAVVCSKCHLSADFGNLLGGLQPWLRSPWRNTEERSRKTQNKPMRKREKVSFFTQRTLWKWMYFLINAKRIKTRV